MSRLRWAIVLLVCIIVSCLSMSPPLYVTDARVQAEVSNFFQDCLRYFHRAQCIPEVKVSVRVVKLPDTTLGQCTIYPNDNLTIVIDPSVLDSSFRKLVIYHELMHCIFDIEHYDDDVDIMNKDNTHHVELMTRFDYYLQRAFARIRLQMVHRKY